MTPTLTRRLFLGTLGTLPLRAAPESQAPSPRPGHRASKIRLSCNPERPFTGIDVRHDIA